MPGNWAPPQGLPTSAGWGDLTGKTAITVSPYGLADGAAAKNNGADYGPDNSGTTTSGIQEAINSGATNIELLNVPGYNFVTSDSILLPATYGIRLVGHAGPWNQTTSGSYIDYSGTGFAIDTASGGASSYNVRGWMDGIFVYSPNGSGYRFSNIIYAGGYIGCTGNGTSGTYGVYIDALSFGAESTWDHIRIGDYPANLLYSNMDHLIIKHLTTGFTYASQDVVSLAGGWEVWIGSWHHSCTNVAPNNGMTIATVVEGVQIDNLFWEASTYTVPANLIINNLSSYKASIGNATANGTDVTPYMQNCDFLNSYTNTRHFRPLPATASVQQQNSETIALEASSWNTSTLKSVNQQALIQLQAGSPGNPPTEALMTISSPTTNAGGITIGGPLDSVWVNKNTFLIGISGTQDFRYTQGVGVTRYLNVATQGLGNIPQYGLDNRTGLTAPDASPITLYTPANNGLYTIKILLNASAYTSGTATYTISWTARDGTVRSIDVAVNVGNTFQDDIVFASVKGGTAITAQLTGTFVATVDVGCVIEAHTAT